MENKETSKKRTVVLSKGTSWILVRWKSMCRLYIFKEHKKKVFLPLLLFEYTKNKEDLYDALPLLKSFLKAFMNPRLKQNQTPFRMSLFTLIVIYACHHWAPILTISMDKDPLWGHDYRQNKSSERQFRWSSNFPQKQDCVRYFIITVPKH